MVGVCIFFSLLLFVSKLCSKSRASHTIMVVFKHLIYEEKLQVDGVVGGITVAPAFILQQGSCKLGHVEVK